MFENIKEGSHGWNRYTIWTMGSKHWVLEEGKRKDGGMPRKNWQKTVTEDIESAGITWEELPQLVSDRNRWRNGTAQHVISTAGMKV